MLDRTLSSPSTPQAYRFLETLTPASPEPCRTTSVSRPLPTADK